jgi:hypothetical protein
MAVVGIDYDGGGHLEYDDMGSPVGELIPVKYESVYIHTSNGDIKFDSGDFILDWYNCMKKFYNELVESEGHLSFSSSVDNFIMDGAPYDSAYLHFDENETPYLRYMNRVFEPTLEQMVEDREIYSKGIEMFVPENTKPSWEELKEYCKHV